MAEIEDPPTKVDIFARALITASPRFAGSTMVIYEGLRERRQARIMDVEAAVASAFPDSADLEGRLAANEELDALLNRAVLEAAQTSIQAKRRLLGRVVVRALHDEAEVDLSLVVTTVLSQIDTPHIRAMTAIRHAVREAEIAGELPVRAEGAEAELNPRIRAAGKAQPDPVIAALTGLGLIEASSTYGGDPIVVGLTPFGTQLLVDLEEAALGE